MHFYVDETGQTGRNLFDKTQPILSYGVLSSEADLDKVAEADLAALRKTLGVERLHAAELGVHRLSEVVDTLLVLQKNHRIRFDICKRKANAVCNTCSLQTKLELLLN